MFDRNAAPAPRISGWLRVLAFALLFWEPLRLGLNASVVIPVLSLRPTSSLLVFVARIVVTAFAIAAGRALLGGHTSALGMAAGSLVVSGLFDAFVYSTTFLPSNIMPGDAPFYIALSLAYHGAWLAYLYRSKRVRATFF